MRRSISFALLLAYLTGCSRGSAPEADEAAAPKQAATAAAQGSAAAEAPLATGMPAPPPDDRHRGDKDKGGGEGEDKEAGRVARPGLMAGGPEGARAWAPPTAGPVRAGEWDDNANYQEFVRYLESESALPFRKMDLRNRRFLVVRDSDGRAVPNCRVTVGDGKSSVSLTTAASGRAVLFPHAEGLTRNDLEASAACQDGQASARFTLAADDGVVDLQLGTKRSLQSIDVELAFILDTTGSMSEEIDSVKATIDKVAQNLSSREVHVRIALVEYKDRSDSFATKVYPFTADLQRFRSSVAGINASGGGDTPEDAVQGVHVALNELQWSDRAAARMAFVIGDAPPHLDYQDGADYTADLRSAARRGIKMYTVAASGMDGLGQAVWRQMAQYTGATNMFVLRGGAGPQSTGGGDPKSSCGGTQQNFSSGNLDELVVAKVQSELASIDRDPLRIPGLGQDENAKPCDQRITWRD